MAHPMVDQLRFARQEFQRGLAEVTDPEAQQRFGNMNCISWIIGHLTWQEQRYWLTRTQGQTLLPELNERLASGKPACTPSGEEMWAAWRQITQAADPWLEALTPELVHAPLIPGFSSVGTFLQRTIYHYWFHLGEGMAIRQLLGHSGLPDFVGDIDAKAPYRSEAGEFAPPPQDKAHFLEAVRSSRRRWQAVVESFSPERKLEPFAGSDWNLKDMIAHLTWHEKEMLGVLRTRLFAGSDLWMLPLEERNSRIYASQRDLPLDQVLAEARDVHEQLVAEIERLDEADLHEPGRIQDLPPDWRFWDILADNTYQHYEDHLAALRSWL